MAANEGTKGKTDADPIEDTAQGSQDGTPPSEGGKGTDKGAAPDSDSILNSKAVQAEIDRRVTDAVKSVERRMADKLEQEREKARQEAEEKKLFEEGNKDELLTVRELKIAELEADIQRRERADKMNALLDKKEVLQPPLRQLFLSIENVDLPEMAQRIDAFQELFRSEVNAAVDAEIRSRYGSEPPARRGNGSPAVRLEDLRTPAAKSAFIAEYGMDKYKELVDSAAG